MFQQQQQTQQQNLNDFKLTNLFGKNVFSKNVMREILPNKVYKSLMKTVEEGQELESELADMVAAAMKQWAEERGCTHYCHLFFPLTGITAAKHDSFLSLTNKGKPITEFSGKELTKGEPDASSLPSGGLRTTFEARGYTVWDCTSPAFIKEGHKTLYIPTSFISFKNEALDQKTPLLRSMRAISKQSECLLKYFNKYSSKLNKDEKKSTIKKLKVFNTCGAEQEFFIIDKDVWKKRLDLKLTGRTLFGSKPVKGQEMSDNYFGNIDERIYNFILDVDKELWKLGIPTKTKHNEVAPSQFEIAVFFTSANLATDHNHILMETIQDVGNRHNLKILLHEKPYQSINGSGKHVNWSLQTNSGENLLNFSGKNFEERKKNLKFFIFCSAVIKAVHEYSDLLRFSCATPGNDFRLGECEAPPAIVSIFLGDEITSVLESIENDEHHNNNNNNNNDKNKNNNVMKIPSMPQISKDTTDRNRTSPFSFTTNKFEFRMVPSSDSIAPANFVINTIVADSIKFICENIEKEIEKLKKIKKNKSNNDDIELSNEEFLNIIKLIIKNIMKKHKNIIFNGNNYSNEWIIEAKKRGLENINNTVDSIPVLTLDKNIKLFESQKVLSKRELESRKDILLEKYINVVNLEAKTTIEIAQKNIIPSVIKYLTKVAKSYNELKNTGIKELSTDVHKDLLVNITQLFSQFKIKLNILKNFLKEFENKNKNDNDKYKSACFVRDNTFKSMRELRKCGDLLTEGVEIKGFPDYQECLFSTK